MLQALTGEPPSLAGVSASLEDLSALREGVAKVLAADCDSRSLHAFLDGNLALEDVLWERAAELGWLGAPLPEAYGGLGLGASAADALLREIGRRAAPGPFIATLAAAMWLDEFGSDELKGSYLPSVAAGELSLAIPATSHSRPLELRGAQIHGSLRMLGSRTAGLAIIPFAGAKVEGWALVACDDASARLEPEDMWDRTRQSCVLTCEGAAPAGFVRDDGGRASRGLDRLSALAIASDSIGAAAGIADVTIAYMKTREQFDRPIGSFQALKHRAANLVVRIATHEHLVSQAVLSDATADPNAGIWAALAKAGASETFSWVAQDCVQLHGGVGHTWDFDCHVFLKRARLNEMLGMNNRAQRDLAAKALAEAVAAGRSLGELPL
jgi:alkylation response protein AidB-like acyl-CoA dehydrogenase